MSILLRTKTTGGIEVTRVERKHPNALKQVYENIGAAAERVVAVGFPAGLQNAYPDGTPVAEVAATQVYGDPGQHIPARDFMATARPDVMKHQHAFAERLAKGNTKLSKEGTNYVLDVLGAQAAADIKMGIIRTNEPELSERTKEHRDETQGQRKNYVMVNGKKKRISGGGDYKPLIDTHHMIESVSWVVRDK